MAHPKRKISSARRNKRRSHDSLSPTFLAKCATTGTMHPIHQAYWHQGTLYYRGQATTKSATVETSS